MRGYGVGLAGAAAVRAMSFGHFTPGASLGRCWRLRSGRPAFDLPSFRGERGRSIIRDFNLSFGGDPADQLLKAFESVEPTTAAMASLSEMSSSANRASPACSLIHARNRARCSAGGGSG